MTWVRFSQGLRLSPVVGESPEALVVLLHDLGETAGTLTPIETRWAITLPTTAFVALDGFMQVDASSSRLQEHATPALNAAGEVSVLDRATRHVEAPLKMQLHSCRLDARRLVLAGFGYGGTLALNSLLGQGCSCAGLLALAAKLPRPLPLNRSGNCKIRLIESELSGREGHDSLREVVA